MNKLFEYNIHIGRYRVLIQRKDIAPESVTTKILADGSVTFDKLAADVRNKFNASLHNLAVSPSVIMRGQLSEVLVDAVCYYEADNIKIKRNGIDIATGSGTSLSFTDAITPLDAVEIVYTAEFKKGTDTVVLTQNIAVALPIYYGAGATYQDATNVAPAKVTPAGKYDIAVDTDGSYLFFVVPGNMTIGKALMNSIPLPLDAPETVLIDGLPYKSYRSSMQYNQFSETIEIL